MKYATFSLAPNDTQFRVGAVDTASGAIIDLKAAEATAFGSSRDFDDMLSLIEGGERVRERVERIVERTDAVSPWCYALGAVHLHAPIPVPPQVRDFSVFELHMKQAGAAMARIRAERTGANGPLPTPADIVLPETFYKQPIYYKANRFNVVGTEHEVRWPAYARLLDYELELAIVLGKRGVNIPRQEARPYVFGYTIFNDFSARDAQEYEMNAPFGPAKGKDFDTGNAMGPWIVTADEIPDPYDLTMIARVNGEEWSRGNSRTMVHRFEDMIAHVSRDETVHPGEIMGSGTVGGGCGLEQNRWLKPGDVVELEIEGIGVLRNRVVSPAAVRD